LTSTGHAAEQLAATFLQHQGLRLLESNYRSRFGEIDLIMQEGRAIVFVEVRLRSNTGFGGAGASITPAKQRKLILTAEEYLSRKGSPACRFDAILMDKLDVRSIQWIKNAFDAT
jgi:putative endonuclease